MSLCKNTGWYGPIITMVMRGKDGKMLHSMHEIQKQDIKKKKKKSINMIKTYSSHSDSTNSALLTREESPHPRPSRSNPFSWEITSCRTACVSVATVLLVCPPAGLVFWSGVGGVNKGQCERAPHSVFLLYV